MRKSYESPEFDLHQFRFAPMMEDPGFENLRPSIPQDNGEGHGGGLDD